MKYRIVYGFQKMRGFIFLDADNINDAWNRFYSELNTRLPPDPEGFVPDAAFYSVISIKPVLEPIPF